MALIPITRFTAATWHSYQLDVLRPPHGTNINYRFYCRHMALIPARRFTAATWHSYSLHILRPPHGTHTSKTFYGRHMALIPAASYIINRFQKAYTACSHTRTYAQREREREREKERERERRQVFWSRLASHMRPVRRYRYSHNIHFQNLDSEKTRIITHPCVRSRAV